MLLFFLSVVMSVATFPAFTNLMGIQRVIIRTSDWLVANLVDM